MHTRSFLPMFQIAVAAACAAVFLTHTAHADDDSRRRAPLDATYVAECGTCHVAYPPRLLPKEAWRTLMAKLDRHFGDDATLDAAAHAKILAYLDAHAGTRGVAAGKDLPRITETPWFQREHRKVAPATWTKPEVKTRANCGACHTRAEAGSYRERELKLPK